jgi:hypothetical protein
MCLFCDAHLPTLALRSSFIFGCSFEGELKSGKGRYSQKGKGLIG